jgi:hypothetical protein
MNGAMIRVDDLRGIGNESESGVGRLHAIVASFEEAHIDLSFDELYALAKRRLADADTLGSLGDTACLVQGDHQFEVAYLQMG